MTSMTNGWNAVCALENSEVNELLLRQFLNNGAGSPGTPLTFGMTIGSSSGNQLPSGAWLGSVTLNPPLVSLSEMAGSQSGQISMTTSDAVVVMNQLDGVFTAAAMSIPPSAAPIQRTVQLQQVAGTVGGDTVGEVALTFPGQPQTQNPGSVYDLMANVVAATPLTYNLGKILNTNSGPGLEPASFELAIQSSSDGTSTALLMLITTTGQPGTSPSLLQYPLSEGVTAALIISEDLFWSEVFPPALTTAFNQGAKAAYYEPFKPIVFTPLQAGDGSWSISVTSGIANIGGLAIPHYLNVTCGGKILLLMPWTAVPLPLTAPEGSFVITASGGSLQQSCAVSFTTGWTQNKYQAQCVQVAMSLSYSCSGPPSLDKTNDVVTFSGTTSSNITLGADAPDWLTSVWSMKDLNQGIAGNLNHPFETGFFPYATAPSINAFALGNLFFPYPTQLTLSDVTLPGDLVLSGSLVAIDTVSPSTATVALGGTVTFTASAEVKIWELSPPKAGKIVGTDPTTAVYTAPTTGAPQTIKISAVTETNGVTYALVQIAPAQAPSTLVVSPTTVMMTANNTTIPIQATDAVGNLVDVTCSAVAGTMQRTGTGQWNYTSPENASGGDTITVTATANPSLTASVTITFVAQDVITVNFDSSTGLASAAANSGYTDFTWAIVPSFAGTIVPTAGDPTQATASIAYPNEIYAICAFYADLEAGAYGSGLNWQNIGF